MMKRLRALWNKRPLLVILAAAALFRLAAAIFSAGYAMSDDHFQVIEIAQRWVDRTPGGNWFDLGEPMNRNLVYPGLHYLLFRGLEAARIDDPQAKMLVVRLLHAAWSMLAMLYGYRIALRIAGPAVARRAGILLALFWLMPFMSVRNLIEFACVPALLVGFDRLLTGREERPLRNGIAAGLWFGLAFTIRYQTALIAGPVGLVLALRREGRLFLGYAAGAIGAVGITTGLIDHIAWGYPFASLHMYIAYNLAHRHDYIVGPWYRYILLVLAALIPPVSALLVAGFLRMWRRSSLLFWPVFLFLFFHSLFPSKQERFILPALPFLLLLGAAGWDAIEERFGLRGRLHPLRTSLTAWFWTLNLALLLTLTFTFSKKSAVEPMVTIARKGDLAGLIWESDRDAPPLAARFYLDDFRHPLYNYPVGKSEEKLREEIDANRDRFPFPNYIVFHGGDRIDERVERFGRAFGKRLALEKKVTPSLADRIIHRMNPRRNPNRIARVYRIEERENRPWEAGGGAEGFGKTARGAS
ncbi:MAG: glycosyltransferase family 39 protein [Candidatus Eisenbacteria bacterium]|nr:glycosyltransferase family 39 protein [Candidatus Eisenbacteria bacterium]